MRNIITMKAAPLPTDGSDVSLFTAAVLHAEGEKILLRTVDSKLCWAQRSRGCMVQPASGDLVLAVDSGTEGMFILDVLMSQEPVLKLSVKGDITLAAQDGTLKLKGRQIEIAPAEAIALEAPFIKISGDEGRVKFRSLRMLSKLAFLSAQRVETFCTRLDITAQQLVQRLTNCFRRIEGLDDTRAERISLQSASGVDIRGGRFFVAVEEEVKIDGRSVHIG